jgi:hypothetical protein
VTESPAELRASPGLALPATWDTGRDVLVWLGAPEPALPRGARVFRVPLDASDERELEGVQLVRTSAELFRAVIALGGAAPSHALVHRTGAAPAELARTLATSLRDALRCRAMARKTVAESGPTWLAQGLANLPVLCASPSIVPLRGAFAGQPCVLVSPGPSLAKNVGELRDLAARALIVSGTHALSGLARAGVAPHLVVSADPGDLARHWTGLDLSAVGAFVIGATCRAETFAAPVRRRFTFGSNGGIDGWLFEPLGEAPGLATGGSVACSMLSLALYLGCDPIALVGQDLSFTERFYAEGNLDGDAEVVPEGGEFRLVKPRGATGIGVPLPDGRLQFTPSQRILEVPGWSGGTVRTTPQLKAFLDWFEAAAPALAGSTRLLNCTEGGAHIRGLEHVPLRAAGAGWERPLEVEPVLERAASGLDVPARRARMAEWARRTLRTLEECTALARRCRALADAGRVEELGRAERKLSAALRGAPLVSLVAQDEIVRASEAARTARTAEENLAAARSLYAVVERAGALLTEPLRSAWRALR